MSLNANSTHLNNFPERWVTLHFKDTGYTFCPLPEHRKLPWRDCSGTDERITFVVLLPGCEKMSAARHEFNISYKTGYKIIKRYNERGHENLADRSRRHYRHADKLPMRIEKLILCFERKRPGWSASDIQERFNTPSRNLRRCARRCNTREEKLGLPGYKPRNPERAQTYFRVPLVLRWPDGDLDK